MLAITFSFFSGLFCFYFAHRIKTGGFEKIAFEILKNAEKKAEEKRLKAEQEIRQKEWEAKRNLDKEGEIQSHKFSKEKERLDKKEDALELRIAYFERESEKIESAKKEIAKEKADLAEKTRLLVQKEKNLLADLEKISGFTENQAKEYLLETKSKEVRLELLALEHKLSYEMEAESSIKAKKILIHAIESLTISTVSDALVATVDLPNEEMKKRIIGREGRNIRALEQATGVNFLVDDTPGAIIISGFDPLRKEVAKIALKDLIKDGRIHPLRIEEAVCDARKRLDKEIEEKAKKAFEVVGIPLCHPELLRLVGKLHLLYSSGQNILSHSIEVALLMGKLADELGLNTQLAKRIGLLHDMGKAQSENEGSHAEIGYALALKYGESQEVANGIGCHHEEMLPLTMEASLVSIANKISSQRPSSRQEAFDQYVKRVSKLEALSSQFEGIEQVYALQTGKEIRVIVEPDKFDDAGCITLAKKIAKKIEKELSYPGKIKVTVVREKKVVEYAS